MKRFIVPALLTVALLTGCGSTSPEDQVREVGVKVIEATISDSPTNACVLTTNTSECASSFVMAKAIGMDIGELAKSQMPKDWRNRMDKAKITITGNKATMAPLVKGDKATEFVKTDGKWLIKFTSESA